MQLDQPVLVERALALEDELLEVGGEHLLEVVFMHQNHVHHVAGGILAASRRPALAAVEHLHQRSEPRQRLRRPGWNAVAGARSDDLGAQRVEAVLLAERQRLAKCGGGLDAVAAVPANEAQQAVFV